MPALPGLDDVELAGKRVLVRVDFNVPLENGAISDDTRIQAALPTLREIREKGGRLVLMSHLGRPKDGVVDAASKLDPVARRLAELLGSQVVKLDDSAGPEVEAAIEAAPADSVVLLENVRFRRGETKGDAALAAAFARLGDVFVNDAFGSSHRDHASVAGVARILPSVAGRLVEREIEAFARVLEDPARPLLAILGGAKVSDKLPVIDNLLALVDGILIGGAMAYTFLAAEGHTIGKSLCEPELQGQVQAARARARELKKDLVLPVDHVIAERVAADATARVCGIDIPAGSMGLDIGPKTRELYARHIAMAKTLVWNGPMGVFELAPFRAGTEAVGRAVAACAGYTVVGGGDSVAAVQLLGLADEIDHISTGGGASLELLEGRDLPGISALGL
jgi:phosphoglycerate kinase